MVLANSGLPKFAGEVELRPSFAPRPRIGHVLFDFDGTLSLIRRGWPAVMTRMFAEMLPHRDGDTKDSLGGLIHDDIMRLNGKQTIYQMIQFAERVRERGQEPRDPLWYKHEYLRRLNARIGDRLDGLGRGSIAPDDLLVYGARALLEQLSALPLTLHLASGTDEEFVRREAELLGIAPFFGGRIYGALDDYQKFSKRMAIDRILRENAIAGDGLLSFGDGYVEIQDTKAVGGMAVAVASDEEANGSGRMDPWKRQRLLDAGADVVIPDYRDALVLVDYLRGGGGREIAGNRAAES